MLSVPFIIGIMIVAALIWFWQDSLGTRERANFAAQAACERSALQFLDGTVSFARLSFARDEYGRIKFRRTYVFDYNTGNMDRLQGFVLLLGQRVESIGFAEEAQADSRTWVAPHSVEQPSKEEPDTTGNVLDLNELRKRRRAVAAPAKKSHDTWH